MTKNKLFLVGVLTVAGFLAMPVLIFAADPLGASLLHSSVGGLGLQSELENSVANVVKTVLAVTGTVFLVLTIVGGLIWMTASGNEEKISKAKKIIIGAVIGLAITLSAYTITSFVASRVGGEGDKSCEEAGGACISSELECAYGSVSSGVCPSGQKCCK